MFTFGEITFTFGKISFTSGVFKFNFVLLGGFWDSVGQGARKGFSKISNA